MLPCSEAAKQTAHNSIQSGISFYTAILRVVDRSHKHSPSRNRMQKCCGHPPSRFKQGQDLTRWSPAQAVEVPLQSLYRQVAKDDFQGFVADSSPSRKGTLQASSEQAHVRQKVFFTVPITITIQTLSQHSGSYCYIRTVARDREPGMRQTWVQGCLEGFFQFQSTSTQVAERHFAGSTRALVQEVQLVQLRPVPVQGLLSGSA